MSKLLRTIQRQPLWVGSWLSSRVGVAAETLTTYASAREPRATLMVLDRLYEWQPVSDSMARWVALIVMGMILGFEPGQAAVIRWTESSNRIYVTGPGFATLSDVKAAQSQAPLEKVAPGVWHLRA